MAARPAGAQRMGQASAVTTGPEDPQPRDIALEQETLEAQSEPDGS